VSVLRWPGPRRPIAIATHHKVGTVLFDQITRRLCGRFGWRSHTVRGPIDAPDPNAVALRFWHGTPDQLPPDPRLRVVHVVRDPREVVVSGYLYHLHTAEQWCVTTPPPVPPPTITYPLVPYPLEGCSTERRAEWLETLGGRSYQENLKSRDQEAGMLFELDQYGRVTIEEMLTWSESVDERVLTVRLDDLMARYDATMLGIAHHLHLRPHERVLFARIARRHDLGRHTAAERAANAHVHDPEPDRWRRYFTDAVSERFDERFGGSLGALGYGQP
jgi:hypothetical protein